MQTIKSILSADLKTAMKEKNDVAIKAIRSLMAAIDNAGAVFVESPKTMPMSGGIAGAMNGLGSTEIPRKELSNKDLGDIILKEIDEIDQTIQQINDSMRPEVALLTEQAQIMRKYLYLDNDKNNTLLCQKNRDYRYR